MKVFAEIDFDIFRLLVCESTSVTGAIDVDVLAETLNEALQDVCEGEDVKLLSHEESGLDRWVFLWGETRYVGVAHTVEDIKSRLPARVIGWLEELNEKRFEL